MFPDVAAAAIKFIHVGAIALWSGGLLALPFLYRQRGALADGPLHNLHAFTRALYVSWVSPAAFVAIGSGTMLIFIEATYELWFSGKLVIVSVLAGIHIFSGLQILRVFEPDGRYPVWRLALVLPATLLTVVSILFVVLGKPNLSVPKELLALFEPGELRPLVGRLTGWWK
jgi:putative membrane protein